MSFRFVRNGCLFPTEVKQGSLMVYVGKLIVGMPLSFLKADYEYNNDSFPISNVMCYLKGADDFVVLRFDGTATKYNNDGVLIGFTRWNPEEMTKQIVMLEGGKLEFSGYDKMLRRNVINKIHKGTIYFRKGERSMCLELGYDNPPIAVDCSQLVEFVKDIQTSAGLAPLMTRVSVDTYEEYNGRYKITGKPILTTGISRIL